MIADHFQYWTIPLLIVTHFKCSFFDEYKCGYEVEAYIYYHPLKKMNDFSLCF